jgi:ATP-dependent Clp protease ATP-binding subunit ClpC
MLGHDSLGDEDLLQGILRSGEGIGAEALASLGVTLEAAQEESEGMLSDTLSSQRGHRHEHVAGRLHRGAQRQP